MSVYDQVANDFEWENKTIIEDRKGNPTAHYGPT